MKYHFKNVILTILSLVLLSGCLGKETTQRRHVGALADLHGFKTKIVKGGKFWIFTAQKVTNPKLPYVIYLEGDGRAFKNKYTISDDPTPSRSMLMRMATMDYRSNVIYIARPCQYVEKELREHCNNVYWSRKRLSLEVVDSIDDVIKSIVGNQTIDLVGFSSGGGMAVLLADRNKKVRSIVTIAGLLDHKLFTQHHRVVDMIGSLNPIDAARRIKHIPQLHLSGASDDIIKPSIAHSYVSQSHSKCVHQEIIPKARHDYGWVKIWDNILNMPVTCDR
jgi:hypothetical protein